MRSIGFSTDRGALESPTAMEEVLARQLGLQSPQVRLPGPCCPAQPALNCRAGLLAAPEGRQPGLGLGAQPPPAPPRSWAPAGQLVSCARADASALFTSLSAGGAAGASLSRVGSAAALHRGHPAVRLCAGGVGCHATCLLQLCPQPLAAVQQQPALMHSAACRGHSGCVNRLAWNETGSLLASGSDDRRVRPAGSQGWGAVWAAQARI